MKSIFSLLIKVAILVFFVSFLYFVVRDKNWFDSASNSISKLPKLNLQNLFSSSQGTSGSYKCEEKATLLEVKKCTYLVQTDKGHGTAFGVLERGYLVTNYHVIQESKDGFVNVWVNEPVKAKILGFDVDKDIALLKIDDANVSLETCNFYDSDLLDLADTVYAVGWPNNPGGDSTITKGIVSRLVQFEDSPPYIQTDSSINPGNSGGPLVSSCGVVGMNTSKVALSEYNDPIEGIGFAIVSNVVKDTAQKIFNETDGSVQIPTTIIGTKTVPNPGNSGDFGNSGQNRAPSGPSPSALVSYSFEEVLFWEERLQVDKDIRKSWKSAVGSEYLSTEKVSKLLTMLDRSIEVAQKLWDGYTNSKITNGQAETYKQEYWKLNSDSSALTKELNYEGSINSYKACKDMWKDLEKKYDMDFSDNIEECENYLN